MALGVGGGITYEVLKTAPATPASVAQQYFDDLGRGDTAGALTLVADADQLSTQASTTLLVPQALSSSSARPTNVQVGTTTPLSDVAGAAAYAVRVSYKVGDSDMTTDFTVIQAPSGAKSTSPYLLQAPFFGLELGDTGGRAVTVNGVPVDVSQTSTFYAFPGAYSATAQGNTLIASDTATGFVAPGSAYAAETDTITFPTPQLEPGAVDAVQSQVNQQLDACAQSTDPNPSNCPFNLDAAYIDGTVSSVQWSISAYPTVSVDADTTPTADAQATISDPNADGIAHYVATYTDYFGASQVTGGDVSFAVNGTAAGSGSAISVTFN